MAEGPRSEGAPVEAARVDRIRSRFADAGGATRRALGRLRGKERSAIAPTPQPEGLSAADDTAGSPADLAAADVSVQRAWRNVRLAIAIVATVAPVVIALISWRIRVSRVRHRGRLVGL